MNKTTLKTSVISVMILSSFIFGSKVMASDVTGTLNTGISTGVTGVVTSPPNASPAAGTYSLAQSVSLTAVDQFTTGIYYTTDNITTPSCLTKTGTLYSSPIPVNSTMTIEAISCYPNNTYSTVESLVYTITPTLSTGGGGGENTITSSVSSGGGGGSISTVGIADFVLLMANWGQTGANNAADFNRDGAVVGIQDFIWLMANWTK
jgi:hypothetical protein